MVLVGSGLLLHPNVMLPRTQIKLVLVLVATLNGMWAQRLLVKVMSAGALSQGAWWGATLIGFLATTSK